MQETVRDKLKMKIRRIRRKQMKGLGPTGGPEQRDDAFFDSGKNCASIKGS